MRSATILTIGLAAIIAPAYSLTTVTFGELGTFALPSSATDILSQVRAEASTQVTQPAFASELSSLPQAKGHDIPSDIASVADGIIYSSADPKLPAWLSAAPTTGAIYSVVQGDLRGAQASAVKEGSKVTAATDSKSTNSSTTTKTSGTSASTSTASSTSTSNGGAAGQPTGAVAAAGAAAAGVLGLAAVL